MGLGTKLVSGDQGLDWGQTLLQSGAAELSKPPSIRRQQPLQQRPEPLKCPRCGSKNTKFCYYNNYNKSQPRHFCKSCKRHWTKGGTLRNVPVGGGRKNKRPKISTAATDAAEVPTTASGPGQQDRPRFPLSGNTTTADQKDISKILYQALIRSSSPFLHETTDGVSIGVPGKPFVRSNGTNTMDSAGLTESAPQNLDTEFDQFSSLGTFDVNAFLVPTSYQSVNAYDHYYGGALDPMEESSITTVNINPSSSSSVPWPSPEFSSALDLTSYWNWNESDALTSADLNTAWDDGGDGALIKP